MPINFNFALLSGFISFIVVVLSVPFLIRYCKKMGWVDQPGERKVHRYPIPRLGGVAVFFATWIGYLSYLWWVHGFEENAVMGSLKAFFGPSLLIFLLGVYDDIRGANAVKKIGVQLIAALWAIYAGANSPYAFNPFMGQIVELNGVWIWSLALIWIVFVTNAVNLIDGLDGLAAGVCLITAMSIFFISKALGLNNVAFLCLAMSGACLGFLVYNSAPARIFLGDSGSLFLGFMLACISLAANVKRSAAIVLLGPPLVLALPILDALMAVVRRFFVSRETIHRKYSPDKPLKKWQRMKYRFSEIFKADQEHIHHILIKIGLSPRRAVWIIYAMTMLLGISAYRSTLYDALASTVVVFLSLSLGLHWLRRRLKRSKL
jgi:UDP-GlcNAc:undecaprenyl-phosphate GlcNAc-1-phosphate transferase